MSERNIPGTADSLFLRQAVDYQHSREYGTILLTRPWSYSILTGFSALIAASVIAFFTFFSTTRKANCEGILLPKSGIIRVLAGQIGLVEKMQVQEGQVVAQGDVLFVLSTERSSTHTDSTENQISKLLKLRRQSITEEVQQLERQSKSRLTSIRQREQNLSLEKVRIDEQIQIQKNRVMLSRQAYDRFNKLESTNYISSAQLQEKQAEYLDQQQRLADLQRIRLATQRDIETIISEASGLLAQAQRETNALARSASAIEQELTENTARSEIVMRAPQKGRVTAINAAIGKTVAPGMRLASIVPTNEELEAEIYVSSRGAGFVQPGMIVWLRYSAYPYQKFGHHQARIREIASVALSAEELQLPTSPQVQGLVPEPLYRIRATLDQQSVSAYGKTLPLKPGMKVDASITLEQRRLYEFLLEPLFSLTGRL